MTCQSALELLLDAEPGEFEGEGEANGSTPLAEHLRGCVRCRRVAAQLMRDTRRLAVAMAAAPARQRTVHVRHVVPAFAMATLVLVVLWRPRPTESPVVRDAPRTIVTPPLAAAPPAPVPNVTSATPVRSAPLKPITGRPFARAVPLAAVRLEPAPTSTSQLSVETNGVTVTPSSGARATVMHTSNPKLLVVWLY